MNSCEGPKGNSEEVNFEDRPQVNLGGESKDEQDLDAEELDEEGDEDLEEEDENRELCGLLKRTNFGQFLHTGALAA